MRTFKTSVSKLYPQGASLGEVLATLTKLPSDVIAEAADKGAVWVQKAKGKTLRERKLEVKLKPQDTVSLFFDPKVLKLKAVEKAQCLFENNLYGIWFKEAGVVTQGTQTSDHASLMRYVEKTKNKDVFLVHRLDRETAGLMVFAYTSEAAGKLSKLFQDNKIQKIYEAVVSGKMPIGETGTINASLDDKEAITHYEVLSAKENMSLLRISIETGRLHQIRRHLDHIGHPVMGDPKYGQGNKNKEGLKLLARGLSFLDPWDKKSKTWSLEAGLSY